MRVHIGKKTIGILISVLIALGGVFYLALFYAPYRMVQDASISGLMLGNRTFAGTITATGDVWLVGNLKILPGTTIQFEVGDDQESGGEIEADGYNDSDLARLASYTKTHGSITIRGRIEAEGADSAPITFTSASPAPQLADWESFIFYGDGSVLDHIIVEYARNGMNPLGSQPNSVARNSIFRHNLWSGPSLSNSGMTILDSDISDAGHEGVDVQSGYATIRGNYIHDTHTGIVVVSGGADVQDNVMENVSDGITAGFGAEVIDKNNKVIPAPPDSNLKWCYQNFCYRMFERGVVD